MRGKLKNKYRYKYLDVKRYYVTDCIKHRLLPFARQRNMRRIDFQRETRDVQLFNWNYLETKINS